MALRLADTRVLGGRGAVLFVPHANARQNHDPDKSGNRKPRDTSLAARNYDERGKQRSHGTAGVSADLKYRLREPVLSAGSHARTREASG